MKKINPSSVHLFPRMCAVLPEALMDEKYDEDRALPFFPQTRGPVRQLAFECTHSFNFPSLFYSLFIIHHPMYSSPGLLEFPQTKPS
jgi:hypothetical protein